MIKVLLFAQLQTEIGRREVTIEKDKMTVEQLKYWFENKYNVTGLNGVMAAINEQAATDADEIKAGDIVALIPPLSGG